MLFPTRDYIITDHLNKVVTMSHFQKANYYYFLLWKYQNQVAVYMHCNPRKPYSPTAQVQHDIIGIPHGLLNVNSR